MTAGNKKLQNHNKREDTDAITSRRTGIAGLLETGLRRFRTGSYIIALIPLYVIGILGMGISATPGVMFFNFITDISQSLPTILYYLILSSTLVTSYFIYGLVLIFVMPLFNFLMPFRLKPFRGMYYSLTSVPWYFHNAFTYIVRYTFLEFITPTPLNMLFYKMMGMKIGKGAHINTTNISDPALIEIDDKVTIGGSVHIIAHYASKGFLIVEPVKIRKGATIGLKATVMGDVEIGEGAVIAPHEVILPKSRIPAGRRPFVTEGKEMQEKKDLPSQDFL
jgi:hypothetical protein